MREKCERNAREMRWKLRCVLREKCVRNAGKNAEKMRGKNGSNAGEMPEELRGALWTHASIEEVD